MLIQIIFSSLLLIAEFKSFSVPIIFVFTALIFAMLGLDVETALSASASSIGNIGPALGTVGPAYNWAHLPELAKWLASFCMLLGRLEIFTVMVLFSRTFWKK